MHMVLALSRSPDHALSEIKEETDMKCALLVLVLCSAFRAGAQPAVLAAMQNGPPVVVNLATSQVFRYDGITATTVAASGGSDPRGYFGDAGFVTVRGTTVIGLKPLATGSGWPQPAVAGRRSYRGKWGA